MEVELGPEEKGKQLPVFSTSSMSVNEICSSAWIIIPDTSNLYLYNHSKFREKVYVGCV